MLVKKLLRRRMLEESWTRACSFKVRPAISPINEILTAIDVLPPLSAAVSSEPQDTFEGAERAS